jgi:hypothetical protein
MAFTRLYLLPPVATTNQPQQVIDVDSSMLLLSQGRYQPVATAPTVTLLGTPTDSVFTPSSVNNPAALNLSTVPQQEVRICWREPVDTENYPNEQLETATDPSGGICQCGITCDGTNLMFVTVQNVVN